MPGIEELMALVGDRGGPPPTVSPNRGEMGPTDRVQPAGGGGAQLYDMMARGRPAAGDVPMPQPRPGGAPGMPPGGMPAAIVQKLQQLMQDPVAMKGMQQFAQQSGLIPGGGGGDPRAAMAAQGVPPSPERYGGNMAGGIPRGIGMSGPATDADLYAAQEANQGVRGDLPIKPDTGGYTGYGEEMDPMPETRQTPEAMVEQEIDRKGATFDGVDAPTANDIQRLKAAPTDSMVEAFDEQFGDGATAKILNTDGAQTDREGGE